MTRHLHGTDHPDIATDLAALAFTAHRAGRYEQSGNLYTEAIVIWRRLPPSDQTIAFPNTLSNYGALLLDLESPAAAIEVLRESSTSCAEMLPADHPRLAIAKVRLGTAFFQANVSQPEAESLLREALPILREAYGEDFPEVLRGEAFLEGMSG